MKAHQVILNLMLLSDFVNSKTNQRTDSFNYSLSQAIDEGFRHPGLRSVTDSGGEVDIKISRIIEGMDQYYGNRLFEYTYLINTPDHFEQVSASFRILDEPTRGLNFPDLNMDLLSLSIHSYSPTTKAPAIRITEGRSWFSWVVYHQKNTQTHKHRDLNEVLKSPLSSDVLDFNLEFSFTVLSDGIERELSLHTTLVEHQIRSDLVLLFILYGNSQYDNGEISSGELRWYATPTFKQEPLSFNYATNLTLDTGVYSYSDYFATSIADNIIRWHGDTELDSPFFKSEETPTFINTYFLGEIDPKINHYREFDGRIDSRLIRIDGDSNNSDALKYYVADATYAGTFFNPEKYDGKKFDGSVVISANDYQASNESSNAPFFKPKQVNAYLSTTLGDHNQNSIDIDIFATGLTTDLPEAEALIDLDGDILVAHYDSLGLDKLNKKIAISSADVILDLEIACPTSDALLSGCDKELSYQGQLFVADEIIANIEYKEDKPYLIFKDGTKNEFLFDFIL